MTTKNKTDDMKKSSSLRFWFGAIFFLLLIGAGIMLFNAKKGQKKPLKQTANKSTLEIMPKLKTPYGTLCEITDFEFKKSYLHPPYSKKDSDFFNIDKLSEAERKKLFHVLFKIRKIQDAPLDSPVSMDYYFCSKKTADFVHDHLEKNKSLKPYILLGYEYISLEGYIPYDPNYFRNHSKKLTTYHRLEQYLRQKTTFLILDIKKKKEGVKACKQNHKKTGFNLLPDLNVPFGRFCEITAFEFTHPETGRFVGMQSYQKIKIYEVNHKKLNPPVEMYFAVHNSFRTGRGGKRFYEHFFQDKIYQYTLVGFEYFNMVIAEKNNSLRYDLQEIAKQKEKNWLCKKTFMIFDLKKKAEKQSDDQPKKKLKNKPPYTPKAS